MTQQTTYAIEITDRELNALAAMVFFAGWIEYIGNDAVKEDVQVVRSLLQRVTPTGSEGGFDADDGAV